jgi:hypothetical protein
MPGIIPHLLAGTGMFLIGEFYFRYKSKTTHPLSDHFLLFGVTLFFSLFPDFPLGLYYVFGVFSPEKLYEYHNLLHDIMTPISIGGLLIIKYIINTKKEPIWIMGIICVLLHVTMDAYIHEGGLWI